MPLQVIIVGAGIAGLCAAVSLRRSGHSVKIFEKSSFTAQIGAALAVSPNGTRVLSNLGFSFEKAHAQKLHVWESVDGINLEPISCLDFGDAEEIYGAAFMAVHRVDLHNELLRLAQEGRENPVTLCLDSRVVGVNEEQGTVELYDSSIHQADLIVAADGLHSAIRGALLGQESKLSASGFSAFRFLIPSNTLKKDPALQKLLKWKSSGSTIFSDTTDIMNERHMVWYGCQGGEIQNFVGIHPAYTQVEDGQDVKHLLLQEFSHFHPELVRILKLSEDVKCWSLFVHDPLRTWIHGKVILIGDAAHPMLPFGGQGANQSIEDGAALGFLLNGVEDCADIPKRLELFSQVRQKRASRIQILSRTRIGREKEVEHELRPFAETPDSMVPCSFPERVAHDFSYDILRKCNEALELQSEVRCELGVK